jgi:hypothetical protein
MKFTNRFTILAIAVTIVAIGAAIFSTGVAGQDDTWQIVRADYGSRTQRIDVTNILADLISRGGVNGRVAVNNQTMGGDPAPGKDKTLHIFARNRRREEREFDFNEGGFVEARMFSARSEDWDDRPANYGRRDQDDSSDLRIIRAYYGVQGRMVNVTELLRGQVRGDELNLRVTNSNLGGDPATGMDKFLVVIYRYQGKESATAAWEGETLSLP